MASAKTAPAIPIEKMRPIDLPTDELPTEYILTRLLDAISVPEIA
jgi:hypothetical protein